MAATMGNALGARYCPTTVKTVSAPVPAAPGEPSHESAAAASQVAEMLTGRASRGKVVDGEGEREIGALKKFLAENMA